jgi:archaellum component FlaC
MSMGDKGRILYEGAKEHIEIIDRMLHIVQSRLDYLSDEIREVGNCTPEEYEGLEMANQAVHKLYVEVVKVLQSVRERKRGA